MKLKPTLSFRGGFAVFCALFFGLSVLAQHPPPDALAENLFPPELLIRFQAEIELTDEQRNSVVAALQKMQPQFEERQQQLQQEVGELGAILKKDRIETEAALAQIDKVLKLEREIKRGQLAMLVGMKNQLSPKQQAKLRQIKKELASGKVVSSLEARIERKLEKVKAGVEQWQNDNRDPSAIGETMQDFEPLMKAGKLKEAEAVLDQELKLLGSPEKNR